LTPELKEFLGGLHAVQKDAERSSIDARKALLALLEWYKCFPLVPYPEGKRDGYNPIPAVERYKSVKDLTVQLHSFPLTPEQVKAFQLYINRMVATLNCTECPEIGAPLTQAEQEAYDDKKRKRNEFLIIALGLLFCGITCMLPDAGKCYKRIFLLPCACLKMVASLCGALMPGAKEGAGAEALEQALEGGVVEEVVEEVVAGALTTRKCGMIQ
jgi:hypothetical protein